MKFLKFLAHYGNQEKSQPEKMITLSSCRNALLGAGKK